MKKNQNVLQVDVSLSLYHRHVIHLSQKSLYKNVFLNVSDHNCAFYCRYLQFITHDAKNTILYIVTYYIKIFCSLLIEGHTLVKKKGRKEKRKIARYERYKDA